MNTHASRNWKTTLAGALGAGATLAQQLLITGSLDFKTIMMAATMAAVAYLAKDADQ